MNNISIDEILDLLEKYRKYMDETQLARLYGLFPDEPVTAAEDNEETDLLVELKSLIKYVRTIRRKLEKKGDEATAREIKDLIQSSSSLFGMVTKLNETILTQTRLRQVETATITTIQSLPEAQQQAFFALLEANLSEQ